MTISWQYHQCKYNEVIDYLQGQQQETQESQHNSNDACWQRTLAREADIALCQFRKSKCHDWHSKALKCNHDYANALQQTSTKQHKRRRRRWIRSVLLTGINGAWLQLYSFPNQPSNVAKDHLILAQREMQRAIATCYSHSSHDNKDGPSTANTMDNNSIYFWNNTFDVLWKGWERIRREWFSSSQGKCNGKNKKQMYVKEQVEHTLRVLYNHDDKSNHITPLIDSINTTATSHESATDIDYEESQPQPQPQPQQQQQLIPHYFISQALVSFSSSFLEQNLNQKHCTKNGSINKCCRYFKHAAAMHGKGSWAYVLYLLFQALQIIHHSSSQKEQLSVVKDLIRKLQPHQTSNLFVCQILSTLYLLLGDFSKALEQWQTLLQLSKSPSFDHQHSNLDQIIITNMAQAFVTLGNAEASLELYLYLLTNFDSNISPDTNHNYEKNDQQTAEPMYVNLSFCKDLTNNGISYSYDHENIQYEPERNDRLLWRLYQVAMTCQDWPTCITSAEHLSFLQHDTEDHQTIVTASSLANIFALLQGRRTSLAWKELNDLVIGKNEENDSLSMNDDITDKSPKIDVDNAKHQILLNLYKADAAILMEQIIESMDEDDEHNIQKQQMKDKIELVHSLTSQCLEFCNQLLLVDNDNDYCKNLVVAVWNNHALTWQLKDNVIKAMHYFQKASQLFKEIKVPPNYSSTLQLAFNLSLTFWKQGYRQEASQTWLLSRNIPILDENNSSSTINNNESKDKKVWIDGLKDLLQVAISNHEILQAKIKRGECEFALEHITGWHPPSFIGAKKDSQTNIIENSKDGIPCDQLWAMDIMMLRQMVSYNTRKEGMKYFMKHVHRSEG